MCAENGFESVGQRGLFLAPAAAFFAAAQDQELTDLETFCLVGETAAINHLRARFRQRALAHSRKFFVKLLREHESEDGVTQEFEALIMGSWRGGFVRHGRVSERELQQFGLREAVAQPPLEFF